MKKREGQDLFEETLRQYQRLCLFLFYPALISLFSCTLGYFYAGYAQYFAFALTRTLMEVWVAPFFQTALSFRYFLPLVISLALGGLFLFLTLMAGKGKRWALGVAVALYGADFVYLFFLLNPALPGAMSPLLWGIQCAVHLAFAILYGFACAKYAKLVRLLKK